MANKPFAIQGSDLTLGGVNIQAGTDSIVIPGITQVTNYVVEEVNENGSNLSQDLGDNAGAITVIDNAEYLYLVDDGDSPSADYVAATYSVDELDDGNIEEITVDTAGVFLAADKNRVEAANMWATTTPTPFVSFSAGNWTQIPFRPKMRAGEIENVGGNADTGNFSFDEDTITNSNGMTLVTDRGSLAMGTNMEVPGVAGHFHIAFDGSNSNPPASDLFLGDDNNYVKLPGYELNPATYGVEIGTDNRNFGPQNIEVGTVDELVPPGGVWRLFIDHEDYPNLGASVSVGDTVTTSWGTPITATITDVVEEPGNWWKIHVAQDITAGFSGGDTVSFGTSGGSHTWRFGTDGTLTLPQGGTISETEVNSSHSILLTPSAPSYANPDMAVKIYPTFNDDDHIHITAGDPTTVDLYLGDDDQYVKIEKNGGDVVIGTNTNTNHWTFDTSGALTLPQGGVIDETPAVETLTLVGANLAVVNQTYTKTSLTLYTGSDGVTIEEISPGIWFIIQGGDTKYSSADDLITWSDSTGGLPVPTGTINTLPETVNITVGTETWTFGTDGSLTLPEGGDIVDSSGTTVLGGNGSLTSTSSIEVQTGDTDRWLVRLRREGSEQDPSGGDGVAVYSTNYDSEGNAIVVARIYLSDGGDGDGIVVAKFTSAGVLVWKKSIGDVDDSFYPESNAVIDSSDNILLAVNPDSSQAKIIVKINGDTGAVVFSEELALTSSFNIRAMAVDGSNNIIIGGDFDLSGNTTAFVAKLTPTANTITWQKSLTNFSDSYGDRQSTIFSVAVDFNNDIIAVGSADRSITGVPGLTETMSVVKITSAGGSSWGKSVLLEGDTPFGEAWNLSLDSVGNIYVAGTYYVDNAEATGNPGYSGLKSNAVVLFKMTTLGVISWDRRVGPGQCDWVGVSTAVGDDGDLYLLASTYQLNPAGGADETLGIWNSTLALARYNKTTGAVIWQSYFDNPQAQEMAGSSNDGPWGDTSTDLMAVRGDKILIGGVVKLGASEADMFGSADNDYFSQGFVAQFDTAATQWSAEGWTLSTSRIPGKLMNTLVTASGYWQFRTDIAMTAEGSLMLSTVAVGISVRRNTSKVNTWTFGKDGTFTAPVDADIRLQQQQLGSATMYGVFNNDQDDIWFETVCHDAEGFAYAVGSNDWSFNRAYIYKFTPEGSAVWQRELRSGTGAQFTVVVTSGVYATPTVTTGGEGYKVGDRILIDGDSLGGDPSNTLTLEVATITDAEDYVGEVATVTIASGVGAVGVTNTYTTVQDPDDNAQCEVRSMTYNPVTGNIEVIITTTTQLGDPDAWSLDSNWSETVIVTIDSGSGTVVSTRTLQDEGDVYAYDAAVSSTGKIAVVGEKFNEYEEYGAITPLVGSGVDKLWVAKSDIDAEHFPGEIIPGGGSITDWWITGTGITDQIRVQNINLYTGLATTTNSVAGSGATITVEFDPTTGAYESHSFEFGGSDYEVGDTITISGLLLSGGTSPANDIVFTVVTVNSGILVSITHASGAHPSTHLLINTNATVNYAAGGATFEIKQNLGGEAFVWTPDFTKAIGGASGDRFTGVAWNTAGTSLYAVGQGHYEVDYNQALVVKFSSAGVITASKFVNDDMGDTSASRGAVALMANDSIVVVHQQYNVGRDESDEVLVTKLDSSLNIIWQQFIGVDSDDGWASPSSNISVAVDPATDEIVIAWEAYDDYEFFDDSAIVIVKLDTDGEVVWKRWWGVGESDTRLNYEEYGNRALSIHGDQFTLVGHTDAVDDDYDNGFIVTLPLDGTGLGEHGIWKYVEPNDDRIKVWRLSGRTATVFTATEHTGSITAESNIKHYYTDYPLEEFTFYPETILSNQGGAVEFADGSRQTFSTAIVPQVKISAGWYTLRAEDSGRHILIETSNYSVVIPNWQRVSLPVGYTVTVINISGSDAYVSNESSDNLQGQMWFSGGDDKTPDIGIRDNGSGQMITLIKIKEGTRSDDGEMHGDIWMVAGADIYNND